MLTAALLMTTLAVPCTGGPGCTVAAKVQRGRLKLLVDTGADITVLSAAAARRAGIRLGKDAPYITAKGVGGEQGARLALADITVGAFEEKDVLVAVMPGLDLGRRGDGLLGMTFLERFETTLGSDLELVPIDAKDAVKKGGRGRSWWSLRFRQSEGRTRALQSLVGVAKSVDREIEDTFGEAESGENLTSMIKRLKAFMDKERRNLRNKAARASVPLDWRR